MKIATRGCSENAYGMVKEAKLRWKQLKVAGKMPAAWWKHQIGAVKVAAQRLKPWLYDNDNEDEKLRSDNGNMGVSGEKSS